MPTQPSQAGYRRLATTAVPSSTKGRPWKSVSTPAHVPCTTAISGLRGAQEVSPAPPLGAASHERAIAVRPTPSMDESTTWMVAPMTMLAIANRPSAPLTPSGSSPAITAEATDPEQRAADEPEMHERASTTMAAWRESAAARSVSQVVVRLSNPAPAATETAEPRIAHTAPNASGGSLISLPFHCSHLRTSLASLPHPVPFVSRRPSMQ